MQSERAAVLMVAVVAALAVCVLLFGSVHPSLTGF